MILIQFHPSSDHLLRQIPYEGTPTQEQEFDSLLIENDPAVVDTQIVDSLVQHTTDGKKIIYTFYPSAIITN